MFRSAEATVAQDWSSLRTWLAGDGRVLDDVPPRQFSGGVANLNFLVRIDGVDVVLRRPPPGPLAEGANDMAREWRVLSTLPHHYRLAPQGIAFCNDSTVLGAPFQLIEYRPGIAIGGRLPPAVRDLPGAPETLVDGVISAMTALHALDPGAVGLGTLGRDDGFLGRQVEGWARRAEVAYDGQPPPPVAAIVTWLRARVPLIEAAPVLIHGDLKLDNMLVDPSTLAPVAVVDWDMTTRGDRLFDLAVLLSYWVDPEDPEPLHALGQVPSLEPGFPRRAEVAARYLLSAGAPPVDLSFHLTLARLRLAVAWEQLHRQFRIGAITDPSYAGFAAIAAHLLDWTADTLSAPPL